ncbi:MAG: 16S rRNA (guanine(966)-N(2))-methyltransferase RsmD [Burkholderiaceae bacterium]|nr:16S rRNA (guanine(966)-N(2))-methyltransferase RsmD [Burkholderiaceae bacterium]
MAAVSKSNRVARRRPQGLASASPPGPGRGAASSASGEVRLIGGRWKRSRIPVPDRPGLRPTPDRVRETLFNWLGQDLTGWRVLDAFAGSGVLGLEAASRGAGSVLLIEQDRQAVIRLREVVERLQADAVQVLQADALAFLARRPTLGEGRFDLVLLDPPFGLGLLWPALQALAPWLAPDAWVYLEDEQAWEESALAVHGWQLHRSARAGAVHFHLLRRVAAAGD